MQNSRKTLRSNLHIVKHVLNPSFCPSLIGNGKRKPEKIDLTKT